jgi:hypothetical protein
MRELKYLTSEQMLVILKQRALDFEADLFGQRHELALAEKLGLPDAAIASQRKIDHFENALILLDVEIDRLENPPQNEIA